MHLIIFESKDVMATRIENTSKPQKQLTDVKDSGKAQTFDNV